MYYFFNFTCKKFKFLIILFLFLNLNFYILNVLLFLFENVCVLPKERRKDRKKKELIWEKM